MSQDFDNYATNYEALLRQSLGAAGGDIVRRYVSSVPPALAALTPIEALLGWLPLGGQYCLLARKAG